jgi:hypothetical protein
VRRPFFFPALSLPAWAAESEDRPVLSAVSPLSLILFEEKEPIQDLAPKAFDKTVSGDKLV